MICAALGLSDRGDRANEIVAKRIVELAKAGERNPDILCEGVLKGFRERQPSHAQGVRHPSHTLIRA
jgi:hypothetical protein